MGYVQCSTAELINSGNHTTIIYKCILFCFERVPKIVITLSLVELIINRSYSVFSPR